MDIFETYAADTEAEEKGKEIQIGKDAFVTVARAGNGAYQRMLAKLYEARKFTLQQKNKEADDCAEEIMIEVMAHTILLGWRGLTMRGEPIEYSVKNAKLLLAVKDFRTTISKLSDDFANFKLATETATAEN